MVVTRDGSWTLISPKDQKRLLLLQKNYPTFLGTGRHRRPDARNTWRCGATSDSGISGSESEDSDTDCEDTGDTVGPKSEGSKTDREDTVNTVRSNKNHGEFPTPLPPDEVEVNYDGEAITIELGSDIKGSKSAMEACVDALCNQLGSVYAHQVLGEGLATLVNDSSQGKSNDECDDDPDIADAGPDIDENELIAQKTKFERDFILEFRDLFSESLSPNHYL